MTAPRRRRVWAPLRFLVRMWRESLQVRSVAIMVLLTSVSVFAFSAYSAYSISRDLFTSRLEQVLSVSNRAVTEAQSSLSASTATDTASIQELMNKLLSDIEGITTSQTVALLRSPGATAGYTQDITSGDLRISDIPSSLRDSVRSNRSGLWWESTELDGEPAIVVGAGLTVQVAGPHELYVAFDLGSEASTLSYVQRILYVGGAVLAVLVGLITLGVVNLVVRPVREVARTSRMLAAGDLAQRIQVRGQHEAAVLGRSFNQMADSIQAQIIQLETLSTMQQRFVSDVSHELRTPLTTIRLASDLVYGSREELDPAAKRSAELLHDQVDRFERLLADLLEVSRFDAGAAKLDASKFELRQLVTRAVSDLLPLAEKRGSTIVVRAPKAKCFIVGDVKRVERVVRNLLANAIEHGEGRPIEVWVGANRSAVAVAVRDHGVGIAKEDQSRVFDRFWRADASRQRTIGGTGLGLSIALEDVNLHNGWLEVWSQVGDGSCFRMTLPRSPGAVVSSSPLGLPPLGAAPSTVTIPVIARKEDPDGTEG